MWFRFCIMYCKFSLGPWLVNNYLSPSLDNTWVVSLHYKGLHTSEKLSTNLSLNSKAESKLGESSLMDFCSAPTCVLCTLQCCEGWAGPVTTQTWPALHTPAGRGLDSPALGVKLRQGCQWGSSQGESSTCTWGEGSRGAYLRRERPMPEGTGLEEAEREPVPEWMAESMEMVMGALQKGEAAMSSTPPEVDISSSSKSSSKEEWSGNSWCLQHSHSTITWTTGCSMSYGTFSGVLLHKIMLSCTVSSKKNTVWIILFLKYDD